MICPICAKSGHSYTNNGKLVQIATDVHNGVPITLFQ